MATLDVDVGHQTHVISASTYGFGSAKSIARFEDGIVLGGANGMLRVLNSDYGLQRMINIPTTYGDLVSITVNDDASVIVLTTNAILVGSVAANAPRTFTALNKVMASPHHTYMMLTMSAVPCSEDPCHDYSVRRAQGACGDAG